MMTIYRKLMVMIFLCVCTMSVTVAQIKDDNLQFEESGEDDGGQLSTSFTDFYDMWRGQNKAAPDFTAYDEEGKAHKLSDFKGKVVVLDFWFTSCHMCIKGFPGMQDLATKYADQDLVVISACLPEKREDFENFVKSHKKEFPALIWMQDRTTSKFKDCIANKDYRMFGAPSQVIINKEGIIVDATNFKPQVIYGLTLAGIDVDAHDLAQAKKEKEELENRIKTTD